MSAVPARALGVDGGGTSTKAVLLDGDVVTALSSGPPTNGLMDADLLARTVALVERTSPDVVGLGLAGLKQPAAARRLAEAVTARTGVPAHAADDAHAALWGAFGDLPGAVVIAGTGSAAIGRDPAGELTRVGGHGFLVGDEGSGYWIGRELVRRALRSLTGVDLRDVEVERLVTRHLGATVGDVEDSVYAAPTQRARLAELAERADQVESPVIDAVFAAAAEELTVLVTAVSRSVGRVPVAMVGGLWNVNRVRLPFAASTGAVMATGSPAVGAARWALDGERRRLDGSDPGAVGGETDGRPRRPASFERMRHRR